jgi:hypothetical protein
VANRNKGRGRSRKRRRTVTDVADPSAKGAQGGGLPQGGGLAPGGGLPHGGGLPEDGRETRRARASARGREPVSAASRGSRTRARPRRRQSGGGGGLSDLRPLGDRPRAPWHPLPLSELLILVGIVGFLVGLSRGLSHGGPPLVAGLAAILIGTGEVTLREHLSGYRSHTLILAGLPVIVLDAGIVVVISPFTPPLRVALVVLDGALFAFLFKLLRARFLDSRRQRVFAGGR